MARMPDFEREILNQLRHAENRVVGGLFRHPHGGQPVSESGVIAAIEQSRAPAVPPVTISTAAANTGGFMSLTALEDDVRGYLTDGVSYLDDMVTALKAKAPALIATMDAVSGSTVGKLVEALGGAVLPPQVEEFVAGVVKDAVARYGQQPQAAPAQPQQPADATAAAPASPAPAPAQPAAQ